MVTSIVAELAVARQEKRQRSDPREIPLPLSMGDVCQPLPSHSALFGRPVP